MSDVLPTVKRLLEEVLGDDLPPDLDIGSETSFSGDLELESIELVQLAERIEGEYGDRVNFVNWFSGKNLEEIIALTVGDLVGYIDQCLSK